LIKVSTTGSAGGHNGVASLLSTSADGFVRYRLGHRAQAARQMDSRTSSSENSPLNNSQLVTQKLVPFVQGLDLLLSRGIEPAMNLNSIAETQNEPNKRNYRATFILDNRGKEDTIDQIIDGVKKVIAELQGEVTAVENIGKKDFARVTDKKLTGGAYVQ
jgi:hypothetical protein